MSLCSNALARRNPWTCLSCSTIARTFQVLIAGSASRSQARMHQRKHSSSKTPSSPKDDSRAITTPTEAPTKEAKPGPKDSTEKRPGTRISRRKSKDGPQDVTGKPRNELTLSLPSVPSTTHLHPSGMLCPLLFFFSKSVHLTYFEISTYPLSFRYIGLYH